MTSNTADFDIPALYEALDQQRLARGLTWEAVAREINSRFAATPARAISSSTITGMRSRRAIEADGVFQMLRWLGRPPESFVPGFDSTATEGTALDDCGPDRILRFDTAAIYAALEAQRRARNLTWREVADEIGRIPPSSLTRLAKGGRTSFPDIMRILRWLGRPAASFTHIAET